MGCGEPGGVEGIDGVVVVAGRSFFRTRAGSLCHFKFVADSIIANASS